jgi:hypothetical protein
VGKLCCGFCIRLNPTFTTQFTIKGAGFVFCHLFTEVVLKLLRKYGLKKLSKLTGEELTDFIQPLKKDKKGNEEE